MAKAKPEDLIPVERIAARIYVIRGQSVMLDADPAELYGVSTGRLNEQVKRNTRRFPGDFAFQLTSDEFDALISQIAISKSGRGGRRKLPWAFTEQGVAMLSSVLSSDRAADVNVAIMRTFVRRAKWHSMTRRLASSSSTSKGYWGRPSRRRNLRSASA